MKALAVEIRPRLPIPALTPCERQALLAIAAGYTQKEARDRLCVSRSTLAFHLRNAREKLRARTTAAAVALLVAARAA